MIESPVAHGLKSMLSHPATPTGPPSPWLPQVSVQSFWCFCHSELCDHKVCCFWAPNKMNFRRNLCLDDGFVHFRFVRGLAGFLARVTFHTLEKRTTLESSHAARYRLKTISMQLSVTLPFWYKMVQVLYNIYPWCVCALFSTSHGPYGCITKPRFYEMLVLTWSSCLTCCGDPKLPLNAHQSHRCNPWLKWPRFWTLTHEMWLFEPKAWIRQRSMSEFTGWDAMTIREMTTPPNHNSGHFSWPKGKDLCNLRKSETPPLQTLIQNRVQKPWNYWSSSSSYPFQKLNNINW